MIAQSVDVTAKTGYGTPMIFISVTTAIALVGWYLRRRRTFWVVYIVCVMTNLVCLQLAPKLPTVSDLLGFMYLPLDWANKTLGYGIHDPRMIFMLFLVLPFAYSLIVYTVILFLKSIRSTMTRQRSDVDR